MAAKPCGSRFSGEALHRHAGSHMNAHAPPPTDSTPSRVQPTEADHPPPLSNPRETNPMRNQNQTRTTLLLALLATGALAAGTLVAAPQDGERVKIVHRMGGMLKQADANGDGNISRAEHDAMRAGHLAALDRNNDGYVTHAEHKAAMEARMEQAFVKRHDKNGDGRVSVDEMAAMGEGMFERMDANKDGIVTPEEMKQGHAGMRKGLRREGMRHDGGGH